MAEKDTLDRKNRQMVDIIRTCVRVLVKIRINVRNKEGERWRKGNIWSER